MAELKIWFLDVGHGDCAYIELPNGARMMIDCGCGADHWPSKLLKHFKVTASGNPIAIPNLSAKYGLDNLIITHPHGDHLADIQSIHDDIGFLSLTGGYRDFIGQISVDQIDFRKREQTAAKKFKEVVDRYSGTLPPEQNRLSAAAPNCIVSNERFIGYSQDMDFNELSWFTSFQIGGHKILFTGDMTAVGVKKILESPKATAFKEFVRGTSVLKIPHHGRENGSSQEMFDAFGRKPLLCVASDKVLDDQNEGTSNIQWYSDRTSDENVLIDGSLHNRKVLTTRNDDDICISISDAGAVEVTTHCFKELRVQLLGNSTSSALSNYLLSNR